MAFSHSGVFTGFHIPATLNGGLRYVSLVTGKGTILGTTTVLTSTAVGGTGTVATGANTVITFSQAQDFTAGMEVPITGSPGATATNGPNSGSSITVGTYTVCTAGLTATTIRLCLNDQITNLTTSGAGGTATVSYGTTTIGVATKGRVVWNFPEPLNQFPNVGISATDATTPISEMALVRQGSEEARYNNFKAGSCDACQFGTDFLAKLVAGNPGVIRDLNLRRANESLETTWESRKPLSYYSYAANRAVDTFTSGKKVWAGTTTSVINDYSGTAGTGGPTDRQTIIFQPDSLAATSMANGPSAKITFSAPHGYATGQPVLIGAAFGGSLPTGIAGAVNSAPIVYWAITGANCAAGSCTTSQIELADTYAHAIAGTALSTSSASSGVLVHSTVQPCSATTTGGGSGNITLSGCIIPALNAPVQFWGNDLTSAVSIATELSIHGTYFVKTVAGSVITVSRTAGGAAITIAGAGVAGYIIASPTFNLNTSGTVPIVDQYGFGLATLHPNSQMSIRGGGVPDRNTVGVLIYDAVLGVWLKTGADVSTGATMLDAGWPPEAVSVGSANAIGAHPYYVSPTFATTDTLTDYMPSLMLMAKNGSASGLIPRFEIPNEDWNGAFQATAIATAHAWAYTALGPSYS